VDNRGKMGAFWDLNRKVWNFGNAKRAMKCYGVYGLQHNTRKRPTSGLMGTIEDFLGFE